MLETLFHFSKLNSVNAASFVLFWIVEKKNPSSGVPIVELMGAASTPGTEMNSNVIIKKEYCFNISLYTCLLLAPSRVDIDNLEM